MSARTRADRRARDARILLLTAVGFGILAHLMPERAMTLALDRQTWLQQPWQLLTGHLVHWNLLHLLGNAFALLLLARLAARRAPSAAWTLAGLLLCSAALLAALPDLHRYRGSSTLVAIYLLPAASALWLRGGHLRAAAAALIAVYLGRQVADGVGAWPSPLLPPDVRSTWELHLLGLAWGGLSLWRPPPADDG
ncbi:MAG: hypothetical protein KDG52_01205 [Rhodocyclaceae bacterium]|nr:hypothetical protein [Rhodocyclaceae bacterium]